MFDFIVGGKQASPERVNHRKFIIRATDFELSERVRPLAGSRELPAQASLIVGSNWLVGTFSPRGSVFFANRQPQPQQCTCSCRQRPHRPR
jgi:hypothetical protein